MTRNASPKLFLLAFALGGAVALPLLAAPASGTHEGEELTLSAHDDHTASSLSLVSRDISALGRQHASAGEQMAMLDEAVQALEEGQEAQTHLLQVHMDETTIPALDVRAVVDGEWRGGCRPVFTGELYCNPIGATVYVTVSLRGELATAVSSDDVRIEPVAAPAYESLLADHPALCTGDSFFWYATAVKGVYKLTIDSKKKEECASPMPDSSELRGWDDGLHLYLLTIDGAEGRGHVMVPIMVEDFEGRGPLPLAAT